MRKLHPRGAHAHRREQHGENHRAPARRNHLLVLTGAPAEKADIEIARETRRQGIECGAQRSHRRGKQTRGHHPANPGGEFAQDEIHEIVPFRPPRGIRRQVVIDPQQHPDERETQRHRNIRQP